MTKFEVQSSASRIAQQGGRSLEEAHSKEGFRVIGPLQQNVVVVGTQLKPLKACWSTTKHNRVESRAHNETVSQGQRRTHNSMTRPEECQGWDIYPRMNSRQGLQGFNLKSCANDQTSPLVS